MKEANYRSIDRTIQKLSKFKKVLFLTCSNRYKVIEKTQTPKSTILAEVIAENLDNVTIINIPDLIIHPCEGNVSREDGNKCGIKAALLKDKEKNPSGFHRCWASIHNEDDELWKQANMFYQKLIERLNWINNRYIPLGESNIIKDITSGFVIVGQHENADNICKLQYEVHDYYGFKADKDLYWYWMAEDITLDKETLQGYLKSYPEFYKDFKIKKIE